MSKSTKGLLLPYILTLAIQQFNNQELQQILEEPVLKYHQIYEVRWLSNQNTACINYLSENQSEDPIAATDLLRKVTSFKFLASTHILEDALGIVKHLSKIF